MNRLPTLLMVAATLLLSATGNGQPNPTAKQLPTFKKPDYKTTRDLNSTKKTVDFDKWVKETTTDILKARPGAFTSNPSADTEVVRSVFSTLKTNWAARNLSDERVLNAVFTAWMDLAVKGFDRTGKEADYTEADLLSAAMNRHEIKIETLPPGASVMIDGYEVGESNNYFFAEKGRWNLELRKNGYMTFKETIDITSSEPSSFVRTLQRAK